MEVVIGEVVLSALLEPLVGKLTSGEFLNFARKTEVEKELKKWKLRLSEIEEVLKDAEEKQVTKPNVKIWLTELRDLAYDVEDIVDEFQTEALASKMREESQASSSTVRKLLPTCCAGLKPSAIKLNMRTGSKLQEITTRLEGIVKKKNELDLGISTGQSSKGVKKRVTTSLVKESDVFGREKDKEAIAGLLMSGDASNSQYSVIPIVGMGGIGKSTLAQLVYNDESLKFDCKAWACVPDDFDILRITKTILEHWGSCEDNNLNVLQQRLKEKLSGKKFLIVLDDIWSNNYEDWTTLSLPFEAGQTGSKVIITTRRTDIASKLGSLRAYALERLSFDESLSIFTQHALDSRNFDSHPDLKEIGEEIVEKCKGLPLAAKVLGGLLRHKQKLEEWEDILNSEIWDLPQDQSGILSALRLSYHHLPSHLKQCFSYCAIFPKDYEFDEDELVSLWMAEGFLQQKMKKKQMQDLGHEYFGDLSSRSFFQQSSNNTSRHVMHDLISDIARFVSGGMCFYLDDKMKGSRSVESYTTIRHSAFTSQVYDISKRFDFFSDMNSLRTFLALPTYASPKGYYHLSSKVLDDLVPRLKCLRALSLAGYTIAELPDTIGALKLLRYLNLSYTPIERLPESVGELLNLQTLRLRGCGVLVVLPECIGNLINLQCLDIRDTDSLQEMPLQIIKLINLRILPKFILGKGNGLGIKELMKLSHLQGQLEIRGLHTVVKVQDAEVANMKEKTGLRDLVLEWIDSFDDARNGRNELYVLNSLKPHRNLEKLSVRSYGGTEFPSWIGDSSFAKMTQLQISNCHKITSLPSLGKLPALRDLSIKGMNALKEVSGEDFPALESLHIGDMREWEQWSWSENSIGKFPKLSELTLENCPKLIGNLPSCLPSLKELHVHACQGVVLRALRDLPSLKTLYLSKISGTVSLHAELMQTLAALEDFEIERCYKLKHLWQVGIDLDKLVYLKRLQIRSCRKLVSLVEGEEGLLPCNLEALRVEKCNNLEKLANGLCSLTLLRDLTISGCRKLVCLSEGPGLPYSLKCLNISDCDSLKSLPDGMMTVVNGNNSNQCLLEELLVQNCPSLKSFPKGKLPTTLKQLSIYDMDNLESLPEGITYCDTREMSHSHLQHLKLRRFSFTSFPTGEFPISLKELHLFNCRIQSLPPLHSLFNLTELKLSHCDELEWFPQEGLPLPNLIHLQILDCQNLRSLPNHMDNLKSLQDLYIWNCPCLDLFTDRDLPPNLTSLTFYKCKITRPMSEWGLCKLTSLKRLVVGCWTPDVDYFPDDEGLLLPTSLTRLRIKDVMNLKYISKGIQRLTSLEWLNIFQCENLQFFPKEGFPVSLGRLLIRKCPLLVERCLKEKGDYWPIIAHIPCVDID